MLDGEEGMTDFTDIITQAANSDLCRATERAIYDEIDRDKWHVNVQFWYSHWECAWLYQATLLKMDSDGNLTREGYCITDRQDRRDIHNQKPSDYPDILHSLAKKVVAHAKEMAHADSQSDGR